MDAAAEIGRNPVSKHQIQPVYGDEQIDAGRDCRIRPRDQILRRERGQGNIHFPCSADHVQDWQPYPVDPCVCCVFSSHSFWTSSSLDVQAGVTQEEGHTGFLIHLLSAVRALIFLARRIQLFLSLVDREVEFCVLTI